MMFLGGTALAQVQQSERYVYDAAGNLIRIETVTTDGPPSVDTIDPAIALSGRAGEFAVSGTNLLNAAVATSRAEITVEVLSTDSGAARFRMAVPADAPLDPVPLTISNAFGQDALDLLLIPPLSASPVPVIVPVGGTLPLRLRLERTAPGDLEFTLALSDPAVAGTVPSVTIPAGSLGPDTDPDVTGLQLGSSGVVVSLAGVELLDFSVQVVAAEYQPADGDTFVSAPVGVTRITPSTGTAVGPLINALGLFKQGAVPPADTALLAGGATGVLVGPGITGIEPDRLQRGTVDAAVTVEGFALQAVDAVAIDPQADLSLGAPVVATDGSQVEFTVSVAGQAATGLRRLTLMAAGEAIPAAVPGAAALEITGPLPVIDSVDPILVARGSEQDLVVRGAHFGAEPELSIVPPDGIDLDPTPPVNPEGTRLTANMVVAGDAPVGQRVVEVVTAAGASGAAAAPDNTVTVTDAELAEIPSLVGPLVGVQKGMADTQRQALLATPALGVARGRLVTGLLPGRGEIGQTLALELRGQDLAAVDQVTFEPADGLSAGTIDAQADRVLVNVTIAADAPRIPRRVTAFTGAVAVPATPGATSWPIVPPPPEIDSLHPNYVVAGGDGQSITVRGRFLEAVTSAQLTPADDLLISGIEVLDSAAVALSVAADAGAALGERVLQLITPTGASEAAPRPTNTLHVVNPEQIVFDFAAPLLGVERVSDDPPSAQHLLASHPVVVATAPVAQSIAPAVVPRAATTAVTVSGQGLDGVDAVALAPPDGVTVAGLTVSPDGAVVTFDLTVDGSAGSGLRSLELRATGEAISFAVPQGRLIRIAGDQPVIESITPNSGFPGAGFTLSVRGRNFQKATGVSATPAQGLQFDTAPAVNADGTELTVEVTLAGDAEPGARLIRVSTPSGTSSDQATPANTFNVLEP